jgi:excisionase family DNA binding protein
MWPRALWRDVDDATEAVTTVGRRGSAVGILGRLRGILSDSGPERARSAVFARGRGGDDMQEHQGRVPLGPEPPGLVDAAWVAARLGVGLRFVRRLVAERRIPYIKLPVRFDRADIERFVEDGRCPALNSDFPTAIAANRRGGTVAPESGATQAAADRAGPDEKTSTLAPPRSRGRDS